MESIEKLRLSLQEKNPSLLLGAGFSYNAQNSNGDRLPLGKTLCELLYKKMFEAVDGDIINEDRADAKNFCEQGMLKDLCSLLRAEGRAEERDNYLTEIYSGATIDGKSSLFNITNYKWNRIFTLNIDCLVENIFDSKNIFVNVWNKDNDDRKNSKNNTLVIKLHGCVKNKEAGYVFDDKEYIQFINEDNCFLRDFADTYSKGDMIFIGTEFQESDLAEIIELYSSIGYDTSGNDYFFIVPSIKNPVLKRKIFSTPNFHHLSWTTEDFFQYLNDKINVNKSFLRELKECGLYYINELYNQKPNYYESQLYAGYESRYDDFFDNWDILRPGLDIFLKKIIKNKRHLVAAIIGHSYVGKSCVAKRLLVDLRNSGYLAFQFSMRGIADINLFLEYLKTLPNRTKVAVLFEEASFYYSLLYKELIKKCPANIKQLVIITSDIDSNHFSRHDILSSSNNIETFKVKETISWSFANNIYEKLKSKNWLSRPELTGSSKDEVIKYARKVDDIIEFLYNISSGRGFEQHFTDIFYNKETTVNYKYLQALTILQKLGLGSIPKRVFSSLLKEYKNQFSYTRFKKDFATVIDDRDYRIKVRCLRLIHDLITKDLDDDKTKDILIGIVKQTYDQFNEGDINEYSEIFQKVLTVKRLLKNNILSLHSIQELLDSIKVYGEKYSFYWIQKGIVYQKLKKYDSASHYFREAIRLSPNSYQANHALAKNIMERAINDNELYFSEGVEIIKRILDNSKYSRGHKYSLHAFIDLSIKYTEKTGNLIGDQDIIYMEDKIMKFSSNDADSYIIDMFKKYVNYCKKNKINTTISIERFTDSQKDNESMTGEEYEIENLDLEFE